MNTIGQHIVGFLFDMQISLILKIQSLSVWKSSCENFCLLAEAKYHAVWKMIVVIKNKYSCEMPVIRFAKCFILRIVG